jgi:magnesium-transporting ATPase (P-type)
VLAAVTLIAFLLGHAINGLDPLDSALGVQYWSADEIEQQFGVAMPEGWDNLSADERAAELTAEAQQDAEHSGLGRVLGKAETLPRTLAFTVLALGQIFHVLSIHAGSRSFFRTWFAHNRFMLWSVVATVLLQIAVIYVPFLQGLFGTYPLTLAEMLLALGLASVLFWLIEIPKLFRKNPPAGIPATA